ncbi:MAG: hypothetical protein HC799_01225 [Limnothrix sp. RL_2_0]|nr:hypothetical protein [Limnothrix sp. RL_2_0]
MKDDFYILESSLNVCRLATDGWGDRHQNLIRIIVPKKERAKIISKPITLLQEQIVDYEMICIHFT